LSLGHIGIGSQALERTSAVEKKGRKIETEIGSNNMDSQDSTRRDRERERERDRQRQWPAVKCTL
jgi:hypothetical protein